jgi:hypothetical protein
MKIYITTFFIALVGCSFEINAVEVKQQQFTPYDKSLGKPTSLDGGTIVFSGSIEITGYLRIQKDNVIEECKGVCAYFIPDAASVKRLPRKIESETGRVMAVEPIALSAAEPVLIKALGMRKGSAVLRTQSFVYEVPGTLTLRELKIYPACETMQYQAKTASINIKPRLAKKSNELKFSGC